MSPFLALFWMPALAAGVVAILVTVAVERLGGRRGGLLGTLPTTIVPAALGFWAGSADGADFRDALFAVPPGMMLNAIFLWCWRGLPPRLPPCSLGVRLGMMVALSLGLWTVLALLLVAGMGAWRASGGSMALVGWGFFAVAVVLGVAVCLQERPAPAGSRRVGPLTLLSRGVLAAVAVGLAVALAATTGPLIAGVMSIFPAIFVTTMVALWWSQGEAVPAGAVGPMMLGSTSVSAFALGAAELMPWLGPAAGAAAAWLGAAVAVTLPAWAFLGWVGGRARRG
ncbi:MAG: hypothetical protein EA398_05020 [Deltaproteobacteria bacterium]|nr:MAG: hypothetical protein EA398_05020 [Deltaproteobacteria bacterium]